MPANEAMIQSSETQAAQALDGAPKPREDDVSWLNRVKFMVVRGFLFGWARCFSLTGLYMFGQFFGTCEWLCNFKRRRRFNQNLMEVYGNPPDGLPPSARGACREHFMRTRCDKLFYLIFDKLPREKILKRVKFHDRHIIDDALARNKGLYVCMSHHGSHHVLILIMALLGYKVAGVRDRNEGPLRKYVQQKYDETFPEFRSIKMFFADTYPRDLYRCFAEGRLLGSALDVFRDRGAHLRTATVELFGKKRDFLTGTLQIALRCGAPIVQGFVVSRKNFYFHLIPKGPLVDPDTATDTPEVVQVAMQHYADNIAEHVLKYPDHLSKS
jgi:lauroyl/myristoyl acyltransferase